MKFKTGKLIPFQHFSIKTEICPEQIIEGVISVTDTSEKSWRNPVQRQPNKAYFGIVNSHEFKIARHIGYRNSFYPVVYGKNQKTESFTAIDIKQRMAGYTQVTCWLRMLFCLICNAITWKQPFFIEGAVTSKIFHMSC